MRRQLPSIAMLCLAPLLLSGCVSRTHLVRRTRQPDIVREDSLEQLVRHVNAQYDAIQTMSVSVELTASTGGGKTGQVKEYPAFAGYIWLQKPGQLRVLLLVPVLRSKALDMVSDGENFKLLIPPRNKAIVGTNSVTEHSSNGLENLRPNVFFDSLLIKGPSADQIVSRILDTRIIEPADKTKDLLEVPEYDLEILDKPEGAFGRTERVIHISRDNLQPYRQDIYDQTGQIITRTTYSDYQKYGTIQFPSKIHIQRPLDEYSLTLTLTKATFDEKLPDDQFDLKIPETVPITQMK